MIAKFWDKIFKAAEFYKEREKSATYKEQRDLYKAKYDAVNEIGDILQTVWDEHSYDKATPKTKLHHLIEQIPGIKAYKDNDGQIFYETDNRHFDSEYEVLAFVVSEYVKNKDIRKGR